MAKWTEEMLAKAVSEVDAGAAVRKVARKYFMNESVLRFRLKRRKLEKPLQRSGRKPVFSQEDEKELARCIAALCSVGFSPTKAEVRVFAAEFIRKRQLSTPFRDGQPGKVWLCNFLKRNNLSLKKAAIMSSARKSATGNPFVVYDFYDKVERIIKSKNLDAHQIWNCDETAFCTDPRAMKVVSAVGEPAHKIRSGAGRENVTVLAACNAAGYALDPMIIFKGKHFQSTWKGISPLPSTLYAVSENGWMTGEVFIGWFQRFVKFVTARPLLLIFDGHVTHLSLGVIELAISEDITLFKLPPHVTDLLQPLDVACFSSLKKRWEELLGEWISVWGPRTPMTKSSFVDHIGAVWRLGLSQSNVMSGFEKTGIFPPDRKKYPQKRLNPRLVKRYEEWLAEGRPFPSLEEMTDIGQGHKPSDSGHVNEKTNPNEKTLNAASSSTPLSSPCKEGPAVENSSSPPPSVPGKRWIRSWVLIDGKPSPIRDAERSFEEIILEKIQGPPGGPVKKRRKVDLMSKVITEKEYADAVRAKNKKVQRKIFPSRKRAVKTSKEKNADELSSSSSESEESCHSFSNSDENDHQEVPVGGKSDSDESTTRLLTTWRGISPPSRESDVLNSWFAGIFSNGKKTTLYIGRALRRFLADPGRSHNVVGIGLFETKCWSRQHFRPSADTPSTRHLDF